jgi:hypothetical protein
VNSDSRGKQHLIILPPPPEKGFFVCGVAFFEQFHEFLVLGKQKILVMIWSKPKLLMCLSADSGYFRPFYAFCEIQKIWNFEYFLANLVTFFFQMRV